MRSLSSTARRGTIAAVAAAGLAGSLAATLPAHADTPAAPSGCIAVVPPGGLPLYPSIPAGVPVGLGTCTFDAAPGNTQGVYVALGGSGAFTGGSSVVPSVGLPGLFDAGNGTCTAGPQSYTVVPDSNLGIAIGAAACLPAAPVPTP